MARLALTVAFAALALAACSSSDPAAPRKAYWNVTGNALKDPEGRTVVLRGMNLAGAHKNKPYWGFQTPPDYARVRSDWGMSSVRFLTTWAAIEPTKGAYDEAYLDELDKRVGWAEDAGLLVVLDMHEDLYGEGFPGGDGAPLWTCDAKYYAAFVPVTPWFYGYLDPNLQHCVDALYTDPDLQSRFVAMWNHVAARLSSHANVVGFDALNEPGWGSFSYASYESDQLEPLYVAVVRAVRQAAPRWVAFLEPGASRNLGVPTRLTPFPFEDVVYSPHSYDADAEAGKGFDAAHRDRLIANLSAYADEAKSLGAALWIGEYGGVATSPGIGDYMNAQYDGAGAVGAGNEYWAYDESDGYGFLDPMGNEKPELAKAVVRPYPERVAGTLASYTHDPATNTLSFVMTADPSVTAPTLVSLPPRLFPNGANVSCGGCVVDASAPGRVALTKVPAGQQTVVVTAK